MLLEGCTGRQRISSRSTHLGSKGIRPEAFFTDAVVLLARDSVRSRKDTRRNVGISYCQHFLGLRVPVS